LIYENRKMKNWLIYGATGYTGVLIAKEAVSRGHKPILSGRSIEKLKPLAESLGLNYKVVNLDKPHELEFGLRDVDLVLHCAGPFVNTSDIMIQACLRMGINYLDITGEIPVLEKTFSYHSKAIESKIALISGVGFDVVPTDCMAKYVSDLMPSASQLEIAFVAISTPSQGTAKSMVEMLPKGGMIRKSGKLEFYPLGKGSKKVIFSDGVERTILPIPWGDLASAFISTKIPNITTYSHYPESVITALPFLESSVRYLTDFEIVRNTLRKLIEFTVEGPNEEMRKSGKSLVYVKASDESGNSKEAWLETLEGYLFTAKSSLLSVEAVLNTRPMGALTPSLAFGKDFIMQVPGTRRFDTI
jgi:short subunit dehydrogenase-like uncharacterized protein